MVGSQAADEPEETNAAAPLPQQGTGTGSHQGKQRHGGRVPGHLLACHDTAVPPVLAVPGRCAPRRPVGRDLHALRASGELSAEHRRRSVPHVGHPGQLRAVPDLPGLPAVPPVGAGSACRRQHPSGHPAGPAQRRDHRRDHHHGRADRGGYQPAARVAPAHPAPCRHLHRCRGRRPRRLGRPARDPRQASHHASREPDPVIPTGRACSPSRRDRWAHGRSRRRYRAKAHRRVGAPSASASMGGISRLPEPSVATTT
jgi:hypothetical protein